jgi:hypothetical protein
MNVLVKHKSTNITSHVISYSREHKICSGIGTLELIIDGTYAASIAPHDSIDIWENGSFQVRYYVSDVSNNVPTGTITLQCQDKSKYLVDYFIPTSYVVDYPSYTRYWIEKFLTEAGISYQFNTTSQGNLLSNYTNLGLQPAYDQIMMLLQMSGWYMYFDGNGKAVIGALSTDLASSAGSIGKTDILDIKRVTDDKMLRNRAVVWGQFEPLTQQYAFADVSVHTRDNYDHRDLRAMVVSNSNIPNNSSAYGIANQLIKEFARPTIEKHIVVWGARNFNLGDVLRVDSHVWRGKGLITTFGVSMDRSGLVTNIVLDERCPRLFGFFNFGDYVYVSTYGDGVWRKHIQFDPTWYNFSTGLTDLAITDLYIKDGIFGSVGASGVPFYANTEDGPWHPVTITGLQSSLEDNVPSGIEIIYEVFSGIMARATVVDKETNNVKFGVDTWSGLNLGDYFLNYSGMTTSVSGVSISGGHRGWILEYDPFTGALVGGLGSGIYPISVSGNYDVRVLDLENDGHNDYVSISTGGGFTIPFSNGGFNYGKHTSQPFTTTEDSQAFVGMGTTDTYELEGETLVTGYGGGTPNIVAVFNNESAEEREVVELNTSSGNRFKQIKFTIDPDIGLGRDRVNSATVTSASQAGLTQVIAVEKISADNYRFYQLSTSQDATNRYALFEYRDWDASTNTAGSDVTIGTLTIPRDLVKEAASNSFNTASFKVIGGKIHYYSLLQGSASNDTTDATNYIKFYLMKIDLVSASIEFNGLISQVLFHDRTSTESWTIFELGGAFPPPTWLLQNGDNPTIALFIREWNNVISGSATELNNYLVHSDFGTDLEAVLVQTASSSSDPDFLLASSAANMEASQLTGTGRILWERRTSDNLTYIYNGLSVTIDTVATIPFHYQNANIIPIFGQNDNHYLATTGGDYYWCTPFSLVQGAIVTFPAGYTINSPFKTTSSLTEMLYWQVRNQSTLDYEIFRMLPASGYHSTIKPFSSVGGLSAGGIVVGNFFVGTTSVAYINNANELPSGTRYLVLQRDGSDFNIIEEEAYPIRIDISNNAPLLTVGSGDSSFHSHFIYDSELVSISPALFGGQQVNDYRYTWLEPVSSGVSISGMAGSQTGLYINGSGVWGFDVSTYSGGFIAYYDIPSGAGTRIETTNYGLNGQYIFITTSGGQQMFFQKDPQGFGFDLYSGMPQSMATQIRIDDRN